MRVLILGVFDKEIDRVRRKAPEGLELSFEARSAKNPKKALHAASRGLYDVVVIMTKHMNHGLTDSLRCKTTSARIVLHHGGLSSLAELLNTL